MSLLRLKFDSCTMNTLTYNVHEEYTVKHNKYSFLHIFQKPLPQMCLLHRGWGLSFFKYEITARQFIILWFVLKQQLIIILKHTNTLGIKH